MDRMKSKEIKGMGSLALGNSILAPDKSVSNDFIENFMVRWDNNKLCIIEAAMKKLNTILAFTPVIFLFVVSGCFNDPVTTIDSFDEVSISFDNEGEGEPAIILIHGWANNREIWDAQVSHFSENYQVIAVDLPGFGKSGNNRDDWSIQSFGNDISMILKHLKLDKAVLVGFSLGGPIAIEAAVESPDQVIGVVLVDALHDVALQYPPPVAHYIDSIMMDLVTDPTQEKLLGSGFFKKNIDSAFVRILTMLEGTSRVGWRETLAGMARWKNENCFNSIQAVKSPIIAINSDMQPTKVETFKKYAPTFDVKIVEDVGHLIMWDNTKKFNQLLEESILELMTEK